MTKASNPESFEPRPYICSGPQISEARSLDRNCYASPDFFRLEVEHIHARGWIIVGRTDEWPTAGCYRAVETVGGPVLIVRDDEGELRAFANFCRHRGAQLLEDCGVARKILCPYHAWSYRLNGALLAAPAMEETRGFDKSEWGLLPIRLEIWEGFAFINYSKHAPSLVTDIGDLAGLLASHRLGDMVCTWRKEIEFKCNWKLLLENATETYHTGVVHAATVGAQKSVSWSGVGEWMGIQVLSDKSIAVIHGEPPFKPIAGLSDQGAKGNVLHGPATDDAILLRAGLHVVARGEAGLGGSDGAVDRRMLSAPDGRTAEFRARRGAVLQALGKRRLGRRRRAREATNRPRFPAVSSGAAIVARRPRACVRSMGVEQAASLGARSLNMPAGVSAGLR